MAKRFLVEKRPHVVISIGAGLFNSAVIALIAQSFSAQNSWIVSSLPISFFSSIIAGTLWSNWKPGIILWTWSQVLFWGSAGIIASVIYTVKTYTSGEWGGIVLLATMPLGGIIGCVFGIILGAFSYSRILVWENKANTNAIPGWTAGVFGGIIINVLIVFATKELNIFGAIIGALCGLLTSLVISRFSPIELESNEIKNA